MKSSLYLIFVSMRPKQWIKNGLLFIPLIFSRHVFDVGMLGVSVLAYVVFCFISSSLLMEQVCDGQIESRGFEDQARECLRGF